MTDDDTLVQTLLAAWNDTDSADRRSRLGDLLTGDARYTDPDDDVRGPGELHAVMERVRGTLPAGAVFAQAGRVSGHHGLIHFGWELRLPSGPPIAAGHDVLWTANGRVERVIGFFEPPS